MQLITLSDQEVAEHGTSPPPCPPEDRLTQAAAGQASHSSEPVSLPAARFLRPGLLELTLAEAISDPLIALLNDADGVSAGSFAQLMEGAASADPDDV